MGKIQYKSSYLSNLRGLSFLYYPSELYDLAVLFDGRKIIVKPIIEATSTSAYFKYKGQIIFLRNFTQDDTNVVPPDWAIQWVYDRIIKLPYTIDSRMSSIDKLLLNETIKRRENKIKNALKSFSIY